MISRIDSVPPQIISTCPVQGISLSLFSEYGYHELETLARTSTPIRRLAFLIDTSASELFPQLATRLLYIMPPVQPLHLPCVPFLVPFPSFLHFLARAERVRMQEVLLASLLLLEVFAGLRFFTFLASGASCIERKNEAIIAGCWARVCPSLTILWLPHCQLYILLLPFLGDWGWGSMP